MAPTPFGFLGQLDGAMSTWKRKRSIGSYLFLDILRMLERGRWIRGTNILGNHSGCRSAKSAVTAWFDAPIACHRAGSDHRPHRLPMAGGMDTGSDTPDDAVVILRDPVAGEDSISYSIEVLDGVVPAESGAVSLFIDPFGRPLSPVSVAGIHRRERRRMRRRF